MKHVHGVSTHGALTQWKESRYTVTLIKDNVGRGTISIGYSTGNYFVPACQGKGRGKRTTKEMKSWFKRTWRGMKGKAVRPNDTKSHILTICVRVYVCPHVPLAKEKANMRDRQ
ncbi:hypothetical protein PoB_000322200 [Plakobranchus ocellatus]|uniref:Uncharacterized protein n=1 Tax=Plakobranchus ocellatus TaxID=259542 RepID=A0AAV3Y3R5_9GAST|nr:hypothetical protein PoB_000322200 [Plakobranchus ocellatus]